MKYFIEDNKSEKWIDGKGGLTNNPLLAASFSDPKDANIYLMLEQQNGVLINYTVTEHEFL